MPIAAIASVAAPIIGGVMASNAASKAASTQAKSADKATALQREMFEKQLELQKPFYEAGLTGQNALLQYLGLGGDKTAANYGAGMKPFTAAAMYEDPGYQFRLSEGVNALNKTAAARGGMLSGRALAEAARYGQDYASGEYQNAYNRYWNQRNQMLNPLEALRGQAQTSASTLGQAGQTYAANAGNAMMAGANARASGYVGGANALNQALGGAYQNYMNLPSQTASPYEFGAGGYYGAGPFMPGGQ
jgi:hypothetical protein